MWDAETGGALLVIDVGSEVKALAFFVDPATGAPRLACGTLSGWEGACASSTRSRAARRCSCFDVGSGVNALAFFADPATGAPRLACGCDDGKVRVFDPVAGGEALVVIDVGSGVSARWWSSRTRRRVRRESLVVVEKRCAYTTRSRAARRWSCSRGIRTVGGLVCFQDPATGELRLASGSRQFRARLGLGRGRRGAVCARGTHKLGCRADGLRGPGDGRDAARERVMGQDFAGVGREQGRCGAAGGSF